MSQYRGALDRITYDKFMVIPKVRLQFSDQLRRLRTKRKLSQEEMAELIGMDSRYYQRLESTKPGAVKIDTLDRIAKALKISLSNLLDI